jgi:ADP-heptose:LPS heptosyltransferase
MTEKAERILVIRLSALGDIVLCFQAFYEIRAAHPKAHIALLTMPAFESFARFMPWFDEVLIDERAPVWRLDAWWKLAATVRSFHPTLVYDLQGKRRQNILYALTGGPCAREWSGAAPFCKFRRIDPAPTDIHFTDFVADQLRRAGVPAAQVPDLSWLDAPLDDLKPPPKFAVFIPGCAVGRDYKRWPAQNFADIALRLKTQGLDIVAVGTQMDAEAVSELYQHAPFVINLVGRTNLLQLGALARRAACVLGNDSGPTHLMASVGAPVLSLISERVNPVWSAPKGTRAQGLQGKPLANLGSDEVFLALQKMLVRPS